MNVSFNPSQGSIFPPVDTKDKISQFIKAGKLVDAELELASVSEETSLDIIRENSDLIFHATKAANKAKDVKGFVLKLVEIDAKQTAENVHHFNLSESDKLEVIRAIAKINSLFVVWTIEKFALQNEDDRSVVFNELLDKDIASIFVFEKFKIVKRDLVYSIAKKAANLNAAYVANIFPKFNLDEKDKAEIIEIIVAKSPDMISSYIDRFDPKHRVSILKRTIMHAAMPGDVVKKASIASESDRFEIATILLNHRLGSLNQFFEEFKIENEDYIFSLALQFVENNPKGTCIWFEHIPLKEEANRFKLALRLSELKVEVGARFKKFRINKIEYGKAVLEKLLENNRDSFGYNMKNFTILNEQDRYEIAMKFAAIDPEEMATYYEYFNIKDPILQKRLLQRLFKKVSSQGANNLVKFLPADENMRFEIAKTIVRNNTDLWPHAKNISLSTVLNYKLNLMLLILETDDIPAIIHTDELTRIEINVSRYELISQLDRMRNKDRKVNPLKENWYSDCNRRVQYLQLYHDAPLVNVEMLLEQLSDIVNPVLRSSVTRSAFAVLLDKKGLQYLQEYKGSAKLLLPLLLMAGILKFKKNDVINKIEKEFVILEKFFSDGRHYEQLLRYLLAVQTASLKQSTAINSLVSIIYPSISEYRSAQMAKRTKEKERLQGESKLKELYFPRIKLLGLVIALGKAECLNKPYELPELKELSKNLFLSEMGIDPKAIDDFEKKYQDHITTLKDESALFVYAGKIKQIDKPEKLQQAYACFITSLLNNSFYGERYAKSPNLNKLSENVEKNSWDQLLKEWKKGDVASTADFPINTEEKEDFDLRKYLYKRLLVDDHIADMDNKFPALASYLGKNCTLDDALKRGNEYEKGILSLFVEMSAAKLDELKIQLKDDIFSEFQNDLNDLKKGLTSSHPLGNLKLVDTDNVSHLFLLGRQTGGCQNIDGNASTNKAALAYVWDGKNRVLGTFDADNMHGRSIFRMLVDDTGKPGLFLERFYTLHFYTSAVSQSLIQRFAIHRAKKLGLPLYSSEYKSDNRYKGTLESIGSNAPFEYFDAGSGMCPDGVFKIHNPYILYQPEIPKKQEA